MNFDYKNRYSKPHENSEPPTLKGPHPEYSASLKIAENFCSKVEHKMPAGMRAYITGSPMLPKSLMYVTWKPPKDYHGGVFATPIFLHDTTSNVNKKIEGVFNTYVKKAKEVEDRNPSQPLLKGLDLTMLSQKA